MRRRDRPLTHDWIWSAIDTLADRRGLTPSALARLAGLDPTTFNRSKRITPEGRPRWPSTESIAKVLEATNTTLDEFATIELEETLEISFDELAEGEISVVPVVGEIRGGLVSDWEPPLEHQMTANGRETIETGRRRFALAVADSSLEPAYSAGNVLVASEAAEPRAGDRVLVKPAGMPVLPRLLVAASVSRIELGTFGSHAKPVALRRRDIDWMARIVLVRQ